MRATLSVFGGLFLAGLVTAALAGQGASSAPTWLPPVSYVCPMESDAAVLEDKAGKCPVCGMLLVPVRLDSKWWCPTHQTNEVHDGPGKCPRDGKTLVQVTLSEFWTCPDDPTEHLLDPGTCADGRPRKVGYEVRAHGDHNPRHGGQFFMAEDQWHHVEGTYPADGTFRLFIYDNFTKPIAPHAFAGRLTAESNGKEQTFPLKPSSDGTALEARVGSLPFPVKVQAWVKFSRATREQPFNFAFSALTVAPPVAKPAATTTAVATPKAETAAARAAETKPKPTQQAAALPAAPASAPPPAPAPPDQPAAPTDPGVFQTFVQIPPALAEAQDESRLPAAIPDLLAELVSRSKDVEALVENGSLAEVWLPAIGTKTVALALESRASTLPERQRAAVTASAKRVVAAAWQIDAYGDLGNKEKIVDAYERLASAVADLQAAYAPR